MCKKLIALLLFAYMLTSCNDTGTEITYSYDNTVIKRVDERDRTTFYYNRIDNDAPKIWVEYSGINDGFSGYLKFEDNGKVRLLSGDGYFQSSNIDTSKFKYKRILAHQRPDLGKNVYFIQLATRYEQEKNLNTGTRIKVTYTDAKN